MSQINDIAMNANTSIHKDVQTVSYQPLVLVSSEVPESSQIDMHSTTPHCSALPTSFIPGAVVESRDFPAEATCPRPLCGEEDRVEVINSLGATGYEEFKDSEVIDISASLPKRFILEIDEVHRFRNQFSQVKKFLIVSLIN